MMSNTRPTEEDAVSMGKLLASMACSLVGHPDEVQVSVDRTSHKVTLSLKTDPSDSGRVIGSRGRTIRALRDILISAARARDVYVEFIYENDKRRQSRYQANNSRNTLRTS